MGKTMQRFELKTISSKPLDEVASAFQKEIRRGNIENAVHWGTELLLSGYGEYAWKRMKIIVSEDVGMANENLPAQIFALYNFYSDLVKKRKQGDKSHSEKLHFIHAILLLTTSPKNRLVDYLGICFCKGEREQKEIPDYAKDKHTKSGRNKGRGVAHFFEEGMKLENEVKLGKKFREQHYFDKAFETLESGKNYVRDYDSEPSMFGDEESGR